jgi:Asp-tRNA(Asn)/Glu-tRNA(Gln) amidotransferase A subunit family amidase
MAGEDGGPSQPSGFGVAALLRAFDHGELDPVAALEQCFQRITAHDETIGAFVWVDTVRAMETATERSRQLSAGTKIGPLHGLPIAVKELIDVAGAPAEYSSQTRRGARSGADAAVVRMLREAGAVVVGTTRSHEFGWGISTQHPVRGGTRNPSAPDRVPGGSSGGAAAAIAAGMVPACLATDTGGSIRIPSAYCGVAGIKPTLGSVPRQGVLPLAPSLDTVGVIAQHVDDLWPILRVLQRSTDDGRPPGTSSPSSRLRGRTFGFAPALMTSHADASRLARYERAIADCGLAGVRLVEVSTPAAEVFRSVFAVIQGFEASKTHTQTLGLYPARKDEYGADVAARLEWAGTITRAEYEAAIRNAEALTVDLEASLERVDALLTPVALVAPPFLDDPDTVWVDGVPVAAREAVMGFTVPQNVAGLPAVTLPAGVTPDGLPFGLQVTCRRGDDLAALDIGSLLERLLNAGEAPASPTGRVPGRSAEYGRSRRDSPESAPRGVAPPTEPWR